MVLWCGAWARYIKNGHGFSSKFTLDAIHTLFHQVLGTPEVARVYIGSFWDQPLRLARLCVIGNDDKILRFDVNRRLFEAEEQDLFADLQSLPRLVWNVWWRQRPLSDISKDLNSEHILMKYCQECSTEKTERPYQESAVSKGTKRRLFCDCFHLCQILTADPYQVHAYIISSLKKDMPSVFGKEKKQKELIKGLDAL